MVVLIFGGILSRKSRAGSADFVASEPTQNFGFYSLFTSVGSVLLCSFAAFKVSALCGGRSTGKLYSTARHASPIDFGMLRPLTLHTLAYFTVTQA